MAQIFKRIPFINGGELLIESETNRNPKLFTGTDGLQQAEYSIEYNGMIWVRLRTRATVNDSWGSWGAWIKLSDTSTIGNIDSKVSKSGDTMTGTLLITNGNLTVHNENIRIRETDITRDTVPSSNTYGNGLYLLDSDGNVFGYFRPESLTNGNEGVYVGAFRKINGSNIYNEIHFRIAADGTRSIAVSDAAAWRTAIGAVNKAGDTMTGKLTANGLAMTAGNNLGTSANWFLALEQNFNSGGTIGYVTKSNMVSAIGAQAALSVESTTTINNIITLNTTNTSEIVSANYAQYGKIAQIYIQWKNKNAISVPVSGNITNIVIGTLVSGKRPKISTGAYSDGDGAGASWYNIATGGNITLGACESTGVARTIAAGTTFNVRATYILP